MKKIFFATMLILGAIGCAPKATNNDTESTPKSVATKVATAQTDVISLDEVFTSEIEAYRENDITPAVSGVRIEEIMVDVGDRVKRGELLVKLDPTLYNQQMINVNKLRSDVERLQPVYEAGVSRAKPLTTQAAPTSYKRRSRATSKNISSYAHPSRALS
ncbi:MAG: biotin/lipoyl-binding protein, partial [Rikenellaceae bacterium]